MIRMLESVLPNPFQSFGGEEELRQWIINDQK